MVAFSYPGVYIEELPSGQHTITGVATSIAAFVGWADQGPVTSATLIQSWSDYQTIFGGLDSRTTLGYAVNQFFANGGQQCYVTRLVWDGTMPPANGTPAVAETAVATGLGYATAQVTATVGSLSGSVTVGVGQAALQGIQVSVGALPASATLPPIPTGWTGTLTATPVYSDGGSSPALPGGSLHWASSDPSIVSVNATTGALQAGSTGGTATVTVTSGVVSGSITLTVQVATTVTLAVTAPVTTLAAGQQTQLTAVASYNSATASIITQGVQWTPAFAASPPPTQPGFVSGSAPGLLSVPGSVSSTSTPTFTATFPWTPPSGPNPSGTLNLQITAAVQTSAAVYPANAVVAMGQPLTLGLQGPQSNNPNKYVAIAGTTSWQSSNPSVAQVSSGGVITTEGAGTTTITATNGPFTATTTVTVLASGTTLSAILLSPSQVTITSGFNQQMTATGLYSDGSTANLTGAVTWGDGGIANTSWTPNGLLVVGSEGSQITGTVTAQWQGVSASVPLTINPPVLQSIQVTPVPATLTSIASGQTVTFNVTGTNSDGSAATTLPAVTWSTSPSGLLSITPSGATSASVTAPATGGGSLTLFANNPGAWGNSLLVTVTAQPPPNSTRFSLLVQRVTPTGQVQTLESYSNLSVSPADPNYVVTVIDNDSAYVTFVNPANGLPVVPTTAPSSTSTAPVSLGGGADGGVLTPLDRNFELALLPTVNTSVGIYALDRVDIFNLLCVPGETDAPTISTLQQFCAQKRAFFIVDSPQNTTIANLIQSGPVGSTPGSITGSAASNSALYFPWVLAPDPLAGNRPTLFPPCGFVAGIYAATDGAIGVWKAPAGINASLTGDSGLQFVLTDLENGSLNPQAVNCLRQFKVYGDVVWGARTLAGNDQQGSQWKYVPIRRLALFLESSLYNGTQWVVFQPNDETLWGQIRLNIGTFLQGYFLKGAFAGSTPQQAYFVKCDAENNPPASVALGVVNILVGFAPLYPAEFVLIQIQQITGQS